MVKTVILYGLALALAALALQWLEYRSWAPGHAGQIYVGLIAMAFLGLGVWVGARLFDQQRRTGAFQANQQALASLGITDREYEVLQLLASGRSNKEIAGRLNVSPNTIKTHVARLFEKLQAERRTQAILHARELQLIP